ncbi:MAG TPA: hypothetical protein GX527_00710 [Clostridiaceae bacterium]|jgi:hypothetical protein|nr:hypothetical protein [Clostridiaceae bacterium]
MTNVETSMGHSAGKARKSGANTWKRRSKGTGPIKNRNLYILTSAILVIAVIAVIIFISVGKNKNVKDLYFEIETKNFVNFMSDIIKKQNDSMAKTKPLREQPSRTRHEISVKLSNLGSGGNQGLNIPEQAIDVINSSKLVLNSRYDLKNDIQTGSLSFLLEGQSFLDINTFLDKNIMGLQIPVIYDKYFVLDKNNVSYAFDRFGIDMPAKKILIPSEINDTLKIPLVEFKDIFTDYIAFMEDIIAEQNISITKNVKLKQVEYPVSNYNNPVLQGKNEQQDNDKQKQQNLVTVKSETSSKFGAASLLGVVSKSDIKLEPETVYQSQESSNNRSKSGKYDVFTIKLNEDEFKAVAEKTIDMLCSDKRLFDITLGKTYTVCEMLKDAGYFDLSKDLEAAYNQAKKYEDINMLKQDLLNIIKYSSFPEGFNMALTVDKSGNIVDRKISFANKMEGESKRMFSLHAGQFFTRLVIEQESSESKSENSLGTDNSNAVIEIEIIRQEEASRNFIYINCVNNIWPDFKAAINTTKTSSEDNKKKTLNTNYILDIDLTCTELGIEKGNMLIDVKREDRYGIDFTLPEINEDTAVDIKSITEDGIETVKTEIQFSAAKFLLTNQYLINAFTSED